MGLEPVYAESCSDNSSIMRTVESLLTNAVKRFAACICDLAETRAPRRTHQEDNQRLRHSKCLSPLLTEIAIAQRKPAMRQQSKPRRKAKPLKGPEQSRLLPVVTSNLLNMICVTIVFTTVLAVLLGVAKWA
jgi:hypothetical protein